MNEILETVFGSGKDLNSLHMCSRAVAIFFIALVLIRVSGRRTFGMRSPMDNIIVILLGAILSRPVVGTSAFLPTIAASLVIALLHRLFGILSFYSSGFGDMIKGKKILLYKDGKFLHNNMRRGMISEKDFMASLRKIAHTESLENIESAWLERDGKISIVTKPQQLA